MSDTPETDKKSHDAMRQFAGHSIGVTEAFEAVDASFARDLERKLNRANALLIEMKAAIKFAKFEAKERLHRLDQAASERTSWLESCEKMKRERDQFIDQLATIGEDCQKWLNSPKNKTAYDFIEMIKNYVITGSK